MAPSRSTLGLLPFGDEADIFNARLPELVHRRHYGAVVGRFIGFDKDDFLFLVTRAGDGEGLQSGHVGGQNHFVSSH